MLTGGCRCGAVRYEAEVDDPMRHGLCHCEDCRASSGAPVVAWLAVPKDSFAVTAGEPTRLDGNGGRRALFLRALRHRAVLSQRAVLPGIVDIQSATLDDAGDFAPAAQIQCAERLGYMDEARRDARVRALSRAPSPPCAALRARLGLGLVGPDAAGVVDRLAGALGERDRRGTGRGRPARSARRRSRARRRGRPARRRCRSNSIGSSAA